MPPKQVMCLSARLVLIPPAVEAIKRGAEELLAAAEVAMFSLAISAELVGAAVIKMVAEARAQARFHKPRVGKAVMMLVFTLVGMTVGLSLFLSLIGVTAMGFS